MAILPKTSRTKSQTESVKERLENTFPYGYTVFGYENGKFTTSINEASTLEAVGEGAVLHVADRSNITFQTKIRIIKLIHFTDPNVKIEQTVLALSGLLSYHELLPVTVIGGVEVCLQILADKGPACAYGPRQARKGYTRGTP